MNSYNETTLVQCNHSEVEEDYEGERLITKCKRCGTRQYKDCSHTNTAKNIRDNIQYEQCKKCKTYINIQSNGCKHTLVYNELQTNDGHTTHRCSDCNIFIRIPIDNFFGTEIEEVTMDSSLGQILTGDFAMSNT